MKHPDPTGNRAIGAAVRKWKQMVTLAIQYRTDPASVKWLKESRKMFTGIFSRLLTDSLEDLQEALKDDDPA